MPATRARGDATTDRCGACGLEPRCVIVETCFGGSSHGAAADAVLALIPADRGHCEAAWAPAVAVLGVLVTEDPGYCSSVLPAPGLSTLTSPSTEYPAAYVAEWVATKLRWGLAADETEVVALREVAAGCQALTVTYERAP